MSISFDFLQVLFWSITYVLVIIFNFRYKIAGLPIIAMTTNFAWETIALTHFGRAAHIVWFTLDFLIVITYFLFCKPIYLKHKFYCILLYLAELFIFHLAFHSGAMLLSSFIIDCTMAIEYLIYICKIGKSGDYGNRMLLILICAAKLIGDLFAWLYYKEFHTVVLIIGIIVFVANFCCLVLSIFRRNDTKANNIHP